jgi:hypothetical protein
LSFALAERMLSAGHVPEYSSEREFIQPLITSAKLVGRGVVHLKLIRLVACFSQQTRTATTERDLSLVPMKSSPRFSNSNE